MKLKRIIASLLATTMAITFVACSSTNSTSSSSSSSSSAASSESSEESEEVEERELIGNTYVGEGLPLVAEPEVYEIYYGANGVDYSGDQNDKPINQILSDGTNITIDWTVIVSDYTTQMTLQVASGQGMYDAYMGWNDETLIATNTNRFYEITEDDMINYGYYLYEDIMENCENGLEEFKKADGKMWTLPGGIYSTSFPNVGTVVYINQTWLDAVGEDMPTTMEEWYDICVKFKNEDPNGNGLADEIPVLINNNTVGTNLWLLMGSSWGLVGENGHPESIYMKIEDGEVISQVDTENMYDFLLTMNEWYDAGLIYSELFTTTAATHASIISEGVQGSFTAYSLTEAQSQDYVAMPVLTAEGFEGQEAHSGDPEANSANMNCIAISATCENPTGIIAWWNYAHKDTETKRIARNGEEGVLWEANDDETATLITADNLPAGIENSTAYSYTYGWVVHCPLLFNDENPVPSETDTYGDGQRWQWYELYEDYQRDEFLPDISPSAEALESITLTQTEVENYIATFVANSVVNGIDENSWADFLVGLDAVNFDDYIQWYQDWVDGVL